jgi:ribonuclease J
MPDDKLKIIPLGGATEIGRCMYIYQVGDQLLVVDCGVGFPDGISLGVDLLMPDISFLLENREKVLGVVITHGHEDHIGALPHVLKQISLPIWASRLTLGLIRRKLHEHGLWADTDWNLVETGGRVAIGPFEVEFVHVNHSIPDACSLIIRTPLGTVVHTGDFKLDQTPIGEPPADIGAFARAGAEGVLALVTDSTNANVPGTTESERVVTHGLDVVFQKAKGRVLVATFSSNLWRVQQVITISEKYGRRIALAGRSMVGNVGVALELGYLTVAEGTMIRLDDVNLYPASEVTILTTGSQGEPLSALTRMAMGEHKQIQVQEGDTVIISASRIPGNEGTINRVVNNLYRIGADVLHLPYDPGVHVSGHANQEDLKLIANVTRPRYILPVHGEFHHQELWRRMGEAMGYTVIKLQDGQVLELDDEEAAIVDHVPAGVVVLDGIGISDTEDAVLRDRQHMAEDGIFLVICTVDTSTGRIISGPDCVSRGAILTTEEETVCEEARAAVVRFLESLPEEGGRDWPALRQDVRHLLNELIADRTGRHPMVVPVVMEL